MGASRFTLPELPHLTLYLRRLRRGSLLAFMLPLFGTLLIWLGWLAGGADGSEPVFGTWLHGTPLSLLTQAELARLVCHWIVYATIAARMAELAVEPGGWSGRRRGTARGGRATPLWMQGTLSGERVLLGVVSGALLSVLPAVAGLLISGAATLALWRTCLVCLRLSRRASI